MEKQLTLDDLTKDEKNLLLYVETVCVDYGGLVDCRKINDDDREILHKWNTQGLVKFSRISFASLQLLRKWSIDKNKTDMVRLSELAWQLAHQERRARAQRMSAKEPYKDIITTASLKVDLEVVLSPHD